MATTATESAMASEPATVSGPAVSPRPARELIGDLRTRGLAFLTGIDGPEAMLALAGQIMTVIAHPDSDSRGITTLTDLGPAGNQSAATGFSSRALPAHTDRSGVAEPPALLMFVCAVPGDTGGENLLADGLAVHGDLAGNHPGAVEALSRPRRRCSAARQVTSAQCSRMRPDREQAGSGPGCGLTTWSRSRRRPSAASLP